MGRCGEPIALGEAVSTLARRLPNPSNLMRTQRDLRAPLAHVLLGCFDATGVSTEHTTCPVRWSSSRRPLRHVARLADALQGKPTGCLDRWVGDEEPNLFSFPHAERDEEELVLGRAPGTSLGSHDGMPKSVRERNRVR